MSSDDRTQIVLAHGVQPGTQLNGIYEIDEKIAAGGMGEVYRGHNIQTGDPVAIKIVLPDFAKDPTILALFRKEASVLNHLAHPAIVRYYVFSIDPGIARPYLAMEFVDGPSLADVMEAGPLSVADACLLISRIASGLSTAHEAGVVHRDLSPDNIILSGGSVAKAKIIDFGIARSETIGGGTLLGGRFAGKYNFVSPEQLGLFGGDVTERSDIYSLGLVFAAALRGAALDMSGSQVDVIEKRRVVPPMDGVPDEMRPIVQAMLRPDPAERPDTMAMIAEWLAPAQQVPAAAIPPPFAGSLYDRTVITTPPTPLPGGMPAIDWSLDPFATPGSSPRPPPWRAPSSPGLPPPTPAADSSRPPASAGGASTDPAGPAPIALDGQERAEASYRYIPSNPDIFELPVVPSLPGEKTSETADAAVGRKARTSRPRRRLPLVVGSAVGILLLAAGTAAWLGGLLPRERVGPELAGITPDTSPQSPTTGAGTPDAATTQPSTSPDASPPASSSSGASPPASSSPTSSPPASSSPSGTSASPSPTPTSPPEAGSAPAAGEVPQTVRPVPPDVASARPDRFAGVGSAVEWLRNYDGGSCFFARALSVSDRSMAIEGFGSSVEPFRRMDTAFRDANGYEPSIGVRQIAEPQCALADFMRQIERDGAPLPVLDLSDDQIKSGESLQGVIRNLSGRTVSLWLIDDQGIVYDLNQHLKRAGDRASFNIKLVDLKTGAPVPQLIFAVSSETPLVSLSHSEPKRLASVLTGVKAEMARENKLVGVAAKYFELGG